MLPIFIDHADGNSKHNKVDLTSLVQLDN